MNSIRNVALAGIFAAAAMLPLTASAQSGLPNQDTYFTFSQAVELPGATLPAGTYLFQLADSPSNRHVVRVMSQDRKTLHTTLLAIPNYSLDKPSDEPQVRFMEGPETGPQAVKVWFYPGRTVGHEFIYPRAQAMKLAARTGEPVLTTKTETATLDNVADQEMTRVDRNGTDTPTGVTTDTATSQAATAPAEPAQTPAPAATTAQAQPRSQEPARTDRAEPARADQADPARADRAEPARTDRAESRRTELPATASFLPLLALVGVGTLVGSRLLRARRVQ